MSILAYVVVAIREYANHSNHPSRIRNRRLTTILHRCCSISQRRAIHNACILSTFRKSFYVTPRRNFDPLTIYKSQTISASIARSPSAMAIVSTKEAPFVVCIARHSSIISHNFVSHAVNNLPNNIFLPSSERPIVNGYNVAIVVAAHHY